MLLGQRCDSPPDICALALNPNGEISAIYDPDGPSGAALALFESGAILLYRAGCQGRVAMHARLIPMRTIGPLKLFAGSNAVAAIKSKSGDA
jgi:hypothetical protein